MKNKNKMKKKSEVREEQWSGVWRCGAYMARNRKLALKIEGPIEEKRKSVKSD